jgi:hypothetical protein
MKHAAELNEPILPDDYPIYGDYLYIVDGKVYRSDWHDITARELKYRLKANEIRRCDAVRRGLIR